jgi:hypothetical protein
MPEPHVLLPSLRPSLQAKLVLSGDRPMACMFEAKFSMLCNFIGPSCRGTNPTKVFWVQYLKIQFLWTAGVPEDLRGRVPVRLRLRESGRSADAIGGAKL